MEMKSRVGAKQKAAKAVPKVTTDMARAWLSTVVSPIESALEVECERLSRGSWSFRASRQDFEYLWPVEAMVAAPHIPNLRQFLRFRKPIAGLVESHDEALDRLRNACRNAFERLVVDSEFRQVAAKGVEPAPPTAHQDDYRYFAEYVVNGWRDLPDNYTYQAFWKIHGADFLALRQRPKLSVAFAAVEDAGAACFRAAEALWKRMRLEQAELADSYGLPPVPA